MRSPIFKHLIWLLNILNKPNRILAQHHSVRLVCHSRHSDAGLAHHLGAQVFSRQLKRSVQQPQMLEEAVIVVRPGNQQRADLLQLGGK